MKLTVGTIDSSRSELPKESRLAVLVRECKDEECARNDEYHLEYADGDEGWTHNPQEAQRVSRDWEGFAASVEEGTFWTSAPIIWVNAYEVSRHYGGPEEGGWWYDAGEPLASIPCETDEEVDRALAQLRDVLGPQYAGRRTRYSVIGDGNLKTTVENGPARAWPEQTPHYE